MNAVKISIKNISGFILFITEQTNLLTLNAAIEVAILWNLEEGLQWYQMK